MNKNIIINSISAILLFSAFIHYQYLHKTIPIMGMPKVIVKEDKENEVIPKQEIEETKAQISTIKSSPDFSKFPINKPQPIQMDFPEENKEELSPREQKNQMRDWLLYTIVNNISLDNEHINKILHNVPIIRYGYNHAIHDLEYGELRSKLLPDNSVIALLPKGSRAKQQDDLAHIADKQRKNLGAIPKKFLVFEYTINPVTKKSSLTRKREVAGKVLFTSKYLYHESKVGSLPNLEAFMKKVQDLTYVQVEEGGLILGGRSLKHRKYKNIGIEEIATIWQSEEENPERGTGFSLDPTYDFEGLKSLVNEYPDMVVTAIKEAGFFKNQIPSHINNILEQIEENNFSDSEKEMFLKLLENRFGKINIDSYPNSEIIEFILKELDKKNPTLLFYVFDYANKLKSENASNFCQKFESYKFQAARYDGKLQGTEVGMILYYTDLLAKMWASNFKWSTPLKVIPEFANAPQLKLPKIYEEEILKYKKGRLWFGYNQNGFQLSDDKTLFFARNATKIFAASQAGLSAREEVPPSASIATRINWWNNHYEEVAKYESKYESLNEIMKWSIVIGWLNNNDNHNLHFLEDIKPDKKNWFPNWVNRHPELKFKKWNEINFHKKGYKGTTTESLPILSSPLYYQFGAFFWTEGGVTLFGKKDLIKISPKSVYNGKIDKLVYNPNITSLGRVKNTFKTAKNVEYQVLNTKILSKPGLQQRLRNKSTEFSPNTTTKEVRSNSNLTQFISTINDIPVGNLNVSPSNNGFKVGFQSRSVGKGNHLARLLSDALDINTTIRKNSSVQEFITLRVNKEYLIRLKGSEKWLELNIKDKPQAEISKYWDSRSSGKNPNSKIIRQKWIAPKEARRIAKSKGRKWKGDVPDSHPPKILEDYANKDYRKITNEVFAEGKGLQYKTEIQEFYKQELRSIDKLLSNPENYFICETRLLRLEKYFGNKPEVTLRRAIFDLNQKSPNKIQEGVNRINRFKVTKKNVHVLDEINQLITDVPMKNANKKTLQGFLNFKARKTNALIIKGEHGIEGKIIRDPKKVIDKLENKKAILLVEDQPGLNNHNWNTSTSQTLSMVLDLNPNVILREMPKETIGKYRPELNMGKIPPGGGKEPPLYNFGVSGNSESNFHIELKNRKSDSHYFYNGYCNDEDEENNNNCVDVYILSLPKKLN